MVVVRFFILIGIFLKLDYRSMFVTRLFHVNVVEKSDFGGFSFNISFWFYLKNILITDFWFVSQNIILQCRIQDFLEITDSLFLWYLPSSL